MAGSPLRPVRLVAAILVCAASIAAAAWLAWGPRLRAAATWGQPVLRESLADGTWIARWDAEPHDAFRLRDHRLVSAAPLFAIARCRTVFAGPVALEFSGEITPGADPGDLSVAWWNGVQEASGYGSPRDGWLLQAGAFDNNLCAIIRVRDGRQEPVARRPLHLQPGRAYRIRGEIDGARLSLAIDGREVLSYEDVFPVASGQIGIFGYYPGKAFTDLAVWNQALPATVSATAIGDDHALGGDLRGAIDAYRRVLIGHREGPLADEAWYKTGWCQLGLGERDAAWRAWSRVAGAPWTDRIALHRLDRAFADGLHDEVIAGLPAVAARSAACRAQAEDRWSAWSERLAGDPALAERYLALRQRLFPGAGPSITAYGRLLIALGRYERALADCADDPLTASDALLHLGRGDEAVARFGRMNWIQRSLREQAGDLEPLAAEAGGSGRPYALAKLGRMAEARAAAGNDPPPEILAAAGDTAALARMAAAAEDAADRDGLALVAALAAGDADAATRLRRAIAARAVDWAAPDAWFAPCVLVPFLAAADGDRAAWDAALAAGERRRAGQRPWHLAGFLAGRLDAAAVLAQPYRAEAEAWLRLGEGVKAERAGDPAAARAAYAAFAALPPEQRLFAGFRPDPLLERFVAWRLQVLSAPR